MRRGIDLHARRDAGRLLGDVFGLYRAYAGRLLLIAACVVVPVDLIVAGLGLGELTGSFDDRPPVEATLLKTLVAFTVTTPLVTAMVVHLVMDAASGLGGEPGRGVSARRAIARGLDLFAPLLGALLIAAAGIALGLLALIVPGIALGVLWAFVAQAVVVDGRRGTDALRRSSELVRGRGWWVFGILLLTNLIVAVFSAVVVVPADSAADAADAQAVTLAGSMVSQIITLPVLALMSTLLYFGLRTEKEGGSPPLPADETPPPPPPPPSPPAAGGAFEPPRPGEG